MVSLGKEFSQAFNQSVKNKGIGDPSAVDKVNER